MLQLGEVQHSWAWVSGWMAEIVSVKNIRPERKIKYIVWMMWRLFGLTIGNLNKHILLTRFRKESIIVECCWYCSVINEQYFPTWKHNMAVNSLENIRYKSCTVICENILNILLFLAKQLQTHWEVATVFILFSWLSPHSEQLWQFSAGTTPSQNYSCKLKSYFSAPSVFLILTVGN